MVEQNTRNFAKLKYNLQEKVGFDLTQQDGRKKRTAKRLSVTNVKGLLLACFVVIFHYINVSRSVFYKKIYLKVKLRWKFFQTKLLSRSSHKVCRLLSSPLLLRKFTNIDSFPQVFEESPSDHDNNSQVIPSSEYNRYASGIISLYPWNESNLWSRSEFHQ